jgi:peptide deformylase
MFPRESRAFEGIRADGRVSEEDTGVTQPDSDASWKAGAAHPDIVTVGDPALRRPVEPLDDIAAASARLDGMVTLLRELKGAGLAAPQVGWPAAAVVVEVRKTAVFPDRPESPLYVMFNPSIEVLSDETEEDWEGCFSVPGLMGHVPRHQSVQVTYLDENCERREQRFTGYVARVVQHELDHLAGKVFLDRMCSMSSISTVANWLQFHP